MNNKGWMRFNRYIYKYWKLQALVIIAGFLTTPLTLFNPYLTKLIIDKAYGNRDLKLFFILAGIGATVFIADGLIDSAANYLSARINRRVNFDMTKDLFRHLQRLPLSFFDNRSTGEHIYRISADVRSVSDFICTAVPQIVTLFPRLIFILVIVFCLNWKLALLTTLLVPISYIHPYFFGRWLKEITQRTILVAQGIYKRLQEVFSHIRLIKSFGKEQKEIDSLEKNFLQRMDLELQNAKISNISSFSSLTLNKALSGIIALYGGYLVIKGAMTLGSLTAIMIYLAQLTGILKSIGHFYQEVIINSVSSQRVAEILDIRPTIYDAPDSEPHSIEKGKIEFKNVTFGYKKDSPVLKRISFSVEQGSKIALAGLSGCGKTTILLLILRLYEQEEGVIFIDGVDLRKIKLDSLKSQIGIVLQEPFLQNDSVANNILYGAENATREEMMEVARYAEAHDFVMNLPNQYDSIIGEMGCKLSEGQKQRISIARTLLRKPKILILDEAMSSLDSETEDKITENIKRVFNSSTIIMVSHRISTVQKMDFVYFIEEGSRVSSGTHKELLARAPNYRELFASQLGLHSS